MNDIKKRLAALAIAGFMVTSTSGCGNTNNDNSVRYEINEQTGQEELTGTVSVGELSNYYIVIISDIESNNKFYLTKKYEYFSRFNSGVYYELIGNNVEIARNGESNFGTVVNTIEFSPVVSTYSTIKENYDVKELEDILNKFIENYNNKNIKVKTYTKK